ERSEKRRIQTGREPAAARIVRVEGRSLKIALQFSMPGIGPPFRNGINHATQGATEFGFEPARLDLDFFNKVRLKVLAHAAHTNVTCVGAVDHIDIFGIRGPVNLKSIEAVLSCALERFLTRAGRERNNRLK